MDDRVWDATTFTKNRERLLRGDVAGAFFAAVTAQARERGLLGDEHFSVDGTLIEAWAGQKSFRPTDDPGGGAPGSGGDFKGQRRRNDTHRSTTGPEARLFRRGPFQEARLCFIGHVLMDHRHGLPVEATLAADKAYDAREFVADLRAEGVTPHIAQHTTRRRSAIDARTTRHPGYAMSQQARRAVERISGWAKTIALTRKTRHRGRRRVGWAFAFALAAYSLVRMRDLTVVA